MCLCTILFEGRKDEVDNQQKIIYDLAKKHQGFRAGAENGERGYFLTFMIGYLRDFGFKYHFIAESFETSLPWKDVSKMCNAVSNRIESDCKRLGIKKKPFISFRVTQVNIISKLGLWHRSMCLHLLRIYLSRPCWSSCRLLSNLRFSQIINYEARWKYFSPPRSRKAEKEIFGQQYWINRSQYA